MMENIQKPTFEGPEEEVVIEDLETLKVLSDPLRMQIIELMGHTPRTVKQIAKQLDMTPNKLYYHIKLLEDHGLIRVVETRLVSGIVEKHYQTTAKEITVADGLLSISKPEGEGEIDALRDSGRRQQIERLFRREQNVYAEILCMDFATNLEKIADHITNIAQALRGDLSWVSKLSKAYEPHCGEGQPVPPVGTPPVTTL